MLHHKTKEVIMSNDTWQTVSRKNVSPAYKPYRPPQKREAPQPSFDELYPNTLNCSVKRPAKVPEVSFSKKVLDGISSSINLPEKKSTLIPGGELSRGLPIRLVMRELELPDDDEDYSKMVFPSFRNTTKKVLTFDDGYEDYNLNDGELAYEIATDDVYDDWETNDCNDEEEFNAELYERSGRRG